MFSGCQELQSFGSCFQKTHYTEQGLGCLSCPPVLTPFSPAVVADSTHRVTCHPGHISFLSLSTPGAEPWIQPLSPLSLIESQLVNQSRRSRQKGALVPCLSRPCWGSACPAVSGIACDCSFELCAGYREKPNLPSWSLLPFKAAELRRFLTVCRIQTAQT